MIQHPVQLMQSFTQSGTKPEVALLLARRALPGGETVNNAFFDPPITANGPLNGYPRDAMKPRLGNKLPWTRGAMLLSVVVAAVSCGIDYTTMPGAQGPVSITAPANFASGITGMLTFSANAMGVASVEFQVDGVAAGPAQTSPPYSVNVDTDAYASGQCARPPRDIASNRRRDERHRQLRRQPHAARRLCARHGPSRA
jgi:hypothetical protein